MYGAPKIRRRLLAACCTLILGGARAAPSPLPATADFQDMTQLAALATEAAQRTLPTAGAHQRLAVGPLPPNLKLPRCSGTVQAERAPGLPSPGRTLIELRCAAPSWHWYVPVRLIGTAPVVLSAHALVAGTVLSAADLLVEQRDSGSLPPGYLDDPALAVGLTAGRAIAGGAVLTNQQLLGTQVVLRGQTVTLLANAAGISVRMPGRALSDGFVNQRVKVENLSSGKIVEGIARSQQVVEIVF